MLLVHQLLLLCDEVPGIVRISVTARWNLWLAQRIKWIISFPLMERERRCTKEKGRRHMITFESHPWIYITFHVYKTYDTAVWPSFEPRAREEKSSWRYFRSMSCSIFEEPVPSWVLIVPQWDVHENKEAAWHVKISLTTSLFRSLWGGHDVVRGEVGSEWCGLNAGVLSGSASPFENSSSGSRSALYWNWNF